MASSFGLKKFLHLNDLTGLAPIVIVTIGGKVVGGNQETIFKIPVNHISSFEFDMSGGEQASSVLRLHDVTYQLLDILLLQLFQMSQSGIPLGVSFGYDDPNSTLNVSSGTIPQVNTKNAKYISDNWLMVILGYDYKILPSGVEVEIQLSPPAMNAAFLATPIYGEMRSIFSALGQKRNLWNDVISKKAGLLPDLSNPAKIKELQDLALQQQFGSQTDSFITNLQNAKTSIRDFEKKLANGGFENQKQVEDAKQQIKKDFLEATSKLGSGIKISNDIDVTSIIRGAFTNPLNPNGNPGAVSSQLSQLPIVSMTKIVDYCLSRIDSNNEVYVPIYPKNADFLYDYQAWRFQGNTISEVIDQLANVITSIEIPDNAFDQIEESQRQKLKMEKGARLKGCNTSFFSFSKQQALSMLPTSKDETKLSGDFRSKIESLNDDGVVHFIYFQFKQLSIQYGPPEAVTPPVAHITNYPLADQSFGGGLLNKLSSPVPLEGDALVQFARGKNVEATVNGKVITTGQELVNRNNGFFQLIELSVNIKDGSFGAMVAAEAEKMGSEDGERQTAGGLYGSISALPQFGAVIDNGQATYLKVNGRMVRVEIIVDNSPDAARKLARPVPEGVTRVVISGSSLNPDGSIKESALEAERKKILEQLSKGEAIRQDINDISDPQSAEAKKIKQAEDAKKATDQIGLIYDNLAKQRSDLQAQLQQVDNWRTNTQEEDDLRAKIKVLDSQIKQVDTERGKKTDPTKVLEKVQKITGVSAESINTKKLESDRKRIGKTFPFGGVNRLGDRVSLDTQAKEYLDDLRTRMQTAIMPELDVTIIGDPNWGLYDLTKKVTVNLQDATGQPTFLSGIYILQGVKHTINAGEFRTTLKLIKDQIDGKDPNTVKDKELDITVIEGASKQAVDLGIEKKK